MQVWKASSIVRASLELKNLSGSKSEKARAVGLELAKRALENGVAKAAFDRGRFLYHVRWIKII